MIYFDNTSIGEVISFKARGRRPDGLIVDKPADSIKIQIELCTTEGKAVDGFEMEVPFEIISCRPGHVADSIVIPGSVPGATITDVIVDFISAQFDLDSYVTDNMNSASMAFKTLPAPWTEDNFSLKPDSDETIKTLYHLSGKYPDTPVTSDDIIVTFTIKAENGEVLDEFDANLKIGAAIISSSTYNGSESIGNGRRNSRFAEFTFNIEDTTQFTMDPATVITDITEIIPGVISAGDLDIGLLEFEYNKATSPHRITIKGRRPNIEAGASSGSITFSLDMKNAGGTIIDHVDCEIPYGNIDSRDGFNSANPITIPGGFSGKPRTTTVLDFTGAYFNLDSYVTDNMTNVEMILAGGIGTPWVASDFNWEQVSATRYNLTGSYCDGPAPATDFDVTFTIKNAAGEVLDEITGKISVGEVMQSTQLKTTPQISDGNAAAHFSPLTFNIYDRNQFVYNPTVNYESWAVDHITATITDYGAWGPYQNRISVAVQDKTKLVISGDYPTDDVGPSNLHVVMKMYNLGGTQIDSTEFDIPTGDVTIRRDGIKTSYVTSYSRTYQVYYSSSVTSNMYNVSSEVASNTDSAVIQQILEKPAGMTSNPTITRQRDAFYDWYDAYYVPGAGGSTGNVNVTVALKNSSGYIIDVFSGPLFKIT